MSTSAEEEKTVYSSTKKGQKTCEVVERKKKYDFLNTCGFVFVEEKKIVWRKKETKKWTNRLKNFTFEFFKMRN